MNKLTKISIIAITCLAACNNWGFSTTPQAMVNTNVVDNIKVVEMKKCSRCNEIKLESDFYNDKNQTSGLRPECKMCNRLKDRTKEGRIRQIYNGQRSHRTNKGLSLPTYNYSELLKWCISKPEFHIIYDKWVSNGFKKSDSPSIDRKDNHKGYCLSNIQIMTWNDNFIKSNMDIRRGDIVTANLWYGGIKPILGVDPKTNKIIKFISVSDAKRKLGLQSANICKVLKGQREHTCGWTFKYDNNEV